MFALPTVDDMLKSGQSGLAALLLHFRSPDGSSAARSIAIVGSSGTLRHSGFGSYIDSHDVVIRHNDAHCTGYENDVGHCRHQIRVGRHLALNHAAATGRLCCGAFTLIVGWRKGNRRGRALLSSNAIAAGAREEFTHEWMERSWDIVGRRGKWPSTGWFGLAMGLAVGRHIGASVSVFGYGGCRTCIRYYDCDGSNSTDYGDSSAEGKGSDNYHPFGAEEEVRRAWASSGAIALYEPSCDLAPPSAPGPPALPSMGTCTVTDVTSASYGHMKASPGKCVRTASNPAGAACLLPASVLAPMSLPTMAGTSTCCTAALERRRCPRAASTRSSTLGVALSCTAAG